MPPGYPATRVPVRYSNLTGTATMPSVRNQTAYESDIAGETIISAVLIKHGRQVWLFKRCKNSRAVSQGVHDYSLTRMSKCRNFLHIRKN